MITGFRGPKIDRRQPLSDTGAPMCPECKSTSRQIKQGVSSAGNPVYKCKLCNRKYVPKL